MVRKIKPANREGDVFIGFTVEPELRRKAQAAIRLLGYGNMRAFMVAKLQQAVTDAHLDRVPQRAAAESPAEYKA